jgi:hypothetical protein
MQPAMLWFHQTHIDFAIGGHGQCLAGDVSENAVFFHMQPAMLWFHQTHIDFAIGGHGQCSALCVGVCV